MGILQKLTFKLYPTLIFLSEEARVKTFQLLETFNKQGQEKDLLELGVDYSISSPKSLKKSNLKILSGKMLKVLCQAIEAGTLHECKLSFPSVAMMLNGKFSTPTTSEHHRDGKESLLLGILEEKVPQEYFLSERRIESRMKSNFRSMVEMSLNPSGACPTLRAQGEPVCVEVHLDGSLKKS